MEKRDDAQIKADVDEIMKRIEAIMQRIEQMDPAKQGQNRSKQDH
jgi:hypothetical protein